MGEPLKKKTKPKTLQEGVSCRNERCLWDREWEKATNYIQNLQQLMHSLSKEAYFLLLNILAWQKMKCNS